ncbi:Uridine phosphorylase [Legionella beliardensis]|uniref:Uridine phosphorylase n=1 Tax=Legionella beliardensis TaxID=91822 RepID=A0A378I595_9GAMM|nr:nucleoside phosphorylase [Legionella beliardensis]STX29876.1 Uridine phosphorylase [Legionella beliardensis]
MSMSFEPRHINATLSDLEGNNGLGRYLFLTGSDERARQFSERFNHVTVRTHPRQHNLYLGTLTNSHGNIDVGAISTGIGGPSADIIINELINLGARRLLRVGTAGSLQPEEVKVGDLVIATSAVRDDKASWDYIYPEYPAVASLEYLIAAGRATKNIQQSKVHFGIVHSKSSLYAREFNYSLRNDNEHYMNSLRLAGVIASEMECAQLFILTSMNTKLKNHSAPVLSGCILAIVGDITAFSDEHVRVTETINAAIELSILTTKELFLIDQQIKPLFDV